MEADLLVTHGKLITMEGDEGLQWLAVKDGLIAAMGRGEDYLPLVGEGTRLIHAQGATVLPGIIDSHFHLVQTAMNEKSLDLSGCHSVEEVGALIQRQVEKRPNDGIFGVGLSNEFLKNGNYPKRQVLDALSNEVPIWINSNDYQVSMLNTYGMLYYKIPYRLEGIEYDEKGVATGIFRGKANAALRTGILDSYPNGKRMENISRLMNNLIRVGITTVNAMEGGYMYSDKDAHFIYEHMEEFPVELTLFYQSLNLDLVEEMQLRRVGGSFYIDGTIGARTAALTASYADAPEEMGSLIFSQGELDEFVASCYRHRLQLSLYAIGDRAIDSVLKAHQRALYYTGIGGLRHRIEHSCLVRPDQVERAAEMGLIFSMSPTYELYWGGPEGMYHRRLGEGYRRTNPLRSVIRGGAILCGGSDSDICDYNPFLGIHAAVNHPVEENRIDLMEALAMYTINGAYAIFREEELGSLAVGKQGDVLVLDRDLLQTDPESLREVTVAYTIKSGAVVYEGGDGPC
ncbi:MAG: amidohydrolase [Tissierellia bacterium]|nr:amidohydrolase [Tissierellia bacterium]